MANRLLVIDDEPRWIEFLRKFLGTMFEVEVVASREKALDVLKARSYDLVLVSSRQLNALKAIRETYPGTRVVVATGQPTTRESIDTYRFGAIDYFAKDFRGDAISEKMIEAIHKPIKTSV